MSATKIKTVLGIVWNSRANFFFPHFPCHTVVILLLCVPCSHINCPYRWASFLVFVMLKYIGDSGHQVGLQWPLEGYGHLEVRHDGNRVRKMLKKIFRRCRCHFRLHFLYFIPGSSDKILRDLRAKRYSRRLVMNV